MKRKFELFTTIKKRKPRKDSGAIHRVCPVCRFSKTYKGPCCEECNKLGYKLNNRTGKLKRTI